MDSSTVNNERPVLDLDSPKIQRYNQMRKIKDKMASAGVGIGGVSVLAAILLIFFYLLYEVIPMFQSAEVKQLYSFELPEKAQPTLYLATEEQNDLGLQVVANGDMVFFSLADGSEKQRFSLPLPEGVSVSSFAVDSDASRLMIFGLSNGQALVAKHQYRVTYPDDKRLITPRIVYPYGEAPMQITESGEALQQISMRDGDSELVVVAHDGRQVSGVRFNKEENMLTEELELEAEALSFPAFQGVPGQLLIDIAQRWLFVVLDNQRIATYNLKDEEQLADVQLAKPISDIRWLLGGISLLMTNQAGEVSQWFMVNEKGAFSLREIRRFDSESQKPALLAIEQRRKGFMTVDENGFLQIFHSTADRLVFDKQMVDGRVEHIALSPRANRALVATADNQLHVYEVKNKHPEVSWSVLWSKVWYESYEKPEYIWQSSSSSNDFEPKLSLVPLSFGTLKAAFYAMLLGAPLAVCGAIYTAYFMTPMMRRKVKPLIELMEALPTVILGFLAGLWLAPFMEKNLAGIFTILIAMPVGILLFAYLMSRLPMRMQNVINDGWHGFILIPVVVLIGMFSFSVSPGIENLLFEGDMRVWLSNEVGIPFDQRNALVVGIAMGFAVVPTIFSIAEDAIFSVPKHLSYGSLALGATPWQTLVGVVIPTASPGIFSALMIGLGRAVGETMIVLMATGNTPIMDANIFEGMRTLSANIAVEVPEAEVDSTHYRVLFLAAFVLFMFTFFVNTGAEMIRHRLRKKYGSL